MLNQNPFIDQPELKKSVFELFGIEYNMEVPVFSKPSEYIAEIDPDYLFDPLTTLSILVGFKYNKKTLIQGYHGTGKSTHLEQIAARLNWSLIRINLDSHISRIDLIGKDAIILEKGQQITQFREGILPWALQRPIALVFDEYDAGRPDIMFVIQRILEASGHLTLLDQNKIIRPHPYFRIFATMNTLGQGDMTGIYHGVQHLNQGQLDRWSIIANLSYLEPEQETKMLLKKRPQDKSAKTKKNIHQMVKLANLIRNSFRNGEISIVMSPRTVIHWAENNDIFNDLILSFKLTFLNRCDEDEKHLINELYQRVFGQEILGDKEKPLTSSKKTTL